jgi:hypothetical protein
MAGFVWVGHKERGGKVGKVQGKEKRKVGQGECKVERGKARQGEKQKKLRHGLR